jgi:hypothetical protein
MSAPPATKTDCRSNKSAVTHDVATASGEGSGATIVDSEDSSLAVTDGERREIVDVSGTHSINPAVEATPLTAAHSVPLTPLTPIP